MVISVGFFASGFVGRNASGTAIVARKIIEIFCADYVDDIKVTIFCNTLEQFSYLKSEVKFDSAAVIMLPEVKGRFLRSTRQYFKYSFFNRIFNIDILHFSVPRLYPFFWKFPASKFVCTFHAGGDVTASKDAFILSRELYNFIAKRTHRFLNGIIAVSNVGKLEIANSYNVPNTKIEVIHPGTDDLWDLDASQLKNVRKVRKKLILVIGRWQEYKNIQIVTQTLETMQYQDYANMFFVFIGKRVSDYAKKIENQLNSVSSDHYLCLEYVSNEDYVSWLRNADVVIFPSLNEGFGLPAFDAYSQGANLIIHNDSAASDLLQHESGVFICNLRSSEQFWKTLNTALENRNNSIKHRRQYLIDIEATWDCMAANYIKYYKKILYNH